MSTVGSSERISVPLDCRSSVYFIDESGSKGSGGVHFVVAAVKTGDPDRLTRGMEVIRARQNVRKELKFRELTQGSVPFFRQLVDLLHSSGSHIGAFVIDKTIFDPFDGKAVWEAHAWVTAGLVKGMTTRRELATLLVDGISTPADVAYGSHIRQSVNHRLGSTRVVSAVSLDSRTCDGLQLADLVASAIAFQRKAIHEAGSAQAATLKSPKAEIARYLARAFDLPDFSDIQSDKVRIRTAVPRSAKSLHSLAIGSTRMAELRGSSALASGL